MTLVAEDEHKLIQMYVKVIVWQNRKLLDSPVALHFVRVETVRRDMDELTESQ